MLGTFVEIEEKLTKSNEEGQTQFKVFNQKFKKVQRSIDVDVINQIEEVKLTAEDVG